MNFEPTYLLLSFIFSTFGLIYFNYGRKQLKIPVMICGLILIVYPYFLDSTLWLCLIGAVLMAIPKFL